MPEFQPGETKTAKVTMRNPTGKAFDYTGFLYMGAGLAVMSEASFRLEAGQEKQVSFPITMPSVGTYPVHIGVFSEGRNIALYKATEDVVISLVPFSYSAPRCWIGPGPGAWKTVGFEATVTNIGNRTTTKTVQLFWRRIDIAGSPMPSYSISLTLAPGGSVVFANPTGDVPNTILIYYGMTFQLWLRDSDGNESARVQISL